MEITASIQQLKGVGEKTAQRFQGLNIASVEDLLRYFPRDYLSYDPPVAIKALEEAEGMITVAGHIQSRPAVRYGNRMKITTVMIRDQDAHSSCCGSICLFWQILCGPAVIICFGDGYRLRAPGSAWYSRRSILRRHTRKKCTACSPCMH